MMRIAILGIVAVLALSGTLHAGVLATDAAAYTDGDGTHWAGSSEFDSGIVHNGIALKATIDWAVYAPGDFHFAGYTPTPGEFVYCYQVDLTGTSEATMLAVSMMDSNEANNIASFTLGAGVAPTTSYFEVPGVENLVAANFDWSPALNAGSISSGLVYCSINAPVDYFGTILDSGQSADGDLPSPSNFIPEPTTITLLVVGLLGWVSRRKR